MSTTVTRPVATSKTARALDGTVGSTLAAASATVTRGVDGSGADDERTGSRIAAAAVPTSPMTTAPATNMATIARRWTLVAPISPASRSMTRSPGRSRYAARLSTSSRRNVIDGTSSALRSRRTRRR